MKLVINIPCYNEEKTLPILLKELPKNIIGIEEIVVQIIDDGSTDNTVAVAKDLGVTNIIRHKKNKGLGYAFKTGLQAALESGAEVFVNTDADNQYPSKYITDLVQPILDRQADLVIGNRTPWKVKHFFIVKRFFQWIGNKITRGILGANIPDTVSGFRAYSREAMLRTNVVTKFSYVLDTIMQAVQNELKIVSIDIEVNTPTRKSRLFRNIFHHMRVSGANLLRMYYLYEPFKTFFLLSTICFIPGLILTIRWFYFYFTFLEPGKIQSLVIASMLIVASIILFALGIIGDSIKINRNIMYDVLYRLKKEELDNGKEKS